MQQGAASGPDAPPPEVQAVFDRYDGEVRDALLALRALVLSVAEETPGVGPLTEALRWGEPAYLTAETGSGTTVRVAPVKREPGKVGVFVHCSTSVIDTMRSARPELAYRGTRAVVFDARGPVPAGIRHVVKAALTYHVAK